MLSRLRVCVVAVLLTLAVLPASAQAAALSVKSISPKAAQAATTVTVTVKGSGFGHGAVLSFDTPELRVFHNDVVNSSTITAEVDVPAEAPHGRHTVYVTKGTAWASCVGCFTVSGLEVHSASPNTLRRGTAATFRVKGRKFEKKTVFSVDRPGLHLLSARLISSTVAELRVAADEDMRTTGDGGVSAANSDGTTAYCACFAVTAAPVTLKSVSPDHPDMTAGQTTVTLRGSGFVGTPTVAITMWDDKGYLHQLYVWNVTRQSSTELTVNVSFGGPPGDYGVYVSNFDFGSASCRDCFTLSGTS